MQLLTEELRKQLLALYTQENEEDLQILVKFFYPDFGWAWYEIEFDGDDTFSGYIAGMKQS